MDKNLIMTRCRKVYIPLENNSIFHSRGHAEFEFVSVFREKEKAITTMEARKGMANYVFTKPEDRAVQHSVCDFYLVPAFLIEKES